MDQNKICGKCGTMDKSQFSEKNFHMCRACVKEDNHRRHIRTREERAERTKKWRAEHPEETKAMNRKASLKHGKSEEGLRYHREWQQLNKDKVAKYQRKWLLKNQSNKTKEGNR